MNNKLENSHHLSGVSFKYNFKTKTFDYYYPKQIHIPLSPIKEDVIARYFDSIVNQSIN